MKTFDVQAKLEKTVRQLDALRMSVCEDNHEFSQGDHPAFVRISEAMEVLTRAARDIHIGAKAN